MSVAGQGRNGKALRIMAAVREIAAKSDMMTPEEMQMIFWQEFVQKHLVGTREKLGKELCQQYEAQGRVMDLEKVVGYALDFKRD